MTTDLQAGGLLPMHTDTGVGERSRPQPPRRRKRNSERLRVTRACDRCKRRKIKCNGTQPCGLCLRAKSTCTFDSAYARGRAPVIPTGSDSELGGYQQTVDGDFTNTSTSPSVPEQAPHQDQHQHQLQPQQQQHGYPVILTETGASQNHAADLVTGRKTASAFAVGSNSASEFAPAAEEVLSSQNSPEPPQTDLHGHYIGPASGVSFLLRVQKRLHQTISFSEPCSIFTFGDGPLHLPDFDPSFCMMLPRDVAQRLVDRYFDFAMPTYRFLHRPTIQEWFDEFYDTLGIMHDTLNAPAKVALLFAIFAHGRVYMPDDAKPGPPDLSARYYLAAEHQLTKEKGSIRLTSVQARLTQCYFLLTQSRINHCWSLFGTVSHLALAIGLNRHRAPDVAGAGPSPIEIECRRRTFWCAYTLDTYLSAVLGRPKSFHDDDIDAKFPACVDDQELHAFTDHASVSSAASDRRPSTMLAPLAHMKIARIISSILRELYSIKPISAGRRASAVQAISKDLGEWRHELTRFLDADLFTTSLLVSIFQRQRDVLNITYWHAIILLYRPYVLSNFARLSLKKQHQQDSSMLGSDEDPQMQDSIERCLDAAMKTVNIIDDIVLNQQLFRVLWLTSYFGFNAAIMLYIYVIQTRDSPPERYSDYLSAATRCQNHLGLIAEKGSLLERYCLVLEELRVEALHQIRRAHPTSPDLAGLDAQLAQDPAFQAAAAMPLDDSPNTAADYTNFLGDGSTLDFGRDIMGFPLSQPSGWRYFSSMVSSGLGNTELFTNNYSL